MKILFRNFICIFVDIKYYVQFEEVYWNMNNASLSALTNLPYCIQLISLYSSYQIPIPFQRL